MGAASRRRRGSTGFAALVAAALVLVAAVAAATPVKDETVLVSRATGGPATDANSLRPEVSSTGRFVAFESHADNLSTDDNNGVWNIFRRDLETGTTAHVNRTTTGVADNYGARWVSISGDGRHVAFSTEAALVAEDTNGWSDVYVRDLETLTTVLASRATGTNPLGAIGNLASFITRMAAGGRYVAFRSDATNLVAGGAAGGHYYVRDLQTSTTTLVDRATDGTPSTTPGAGHDSGVGHPVFSISSDGRFVAFESQGNNLSADDDDRWINIFVRDLVDGTTTLVNRANGSAGAASDHDAYQPSISAGGRYVVFSSSANNLSDIDGDSQFDVFLRDLQAGTTTWVSRRPGSGPAANSGSSSAAISGDARVVGFRSGASDFLTDPARGFGQYYIRDVQTGCMTRASRPSGPTGADDDLGGSGEPPAISSDGRVVVFQSAGTNLSPDDVAQYDIYARGLGDSITEQCSVPTPPPPPPPPGPPPSPPSPPPSPPPPPPPSQTQLGRASVSTRVVTVTRNGIAPLSLRCAGRAACRATVTLQATVDERLLALPVREAKLRKITLGRKAFSIRAGRRATIRVKLSRPGFRLLKRVRTLRANAIVASRQLRGTRTATAKITLRAPR